MSSASLSQRLREAIDFGPVKYGHANYVEKLMALVVEVAGQEALAQTDKKIADRARKLEAILEPKCKGVTCNYQQMFDKYALDVVKAILENEKNVAVGVVGEATEKWLRIK